MRLYVEAMDADLVEFNQPGNVRFDGEEWSVPTLQERRAILYAACLLYTSPSPRD